MQPQTSQTYVPCSIGTCSLRRHRHMFHAVQGHVALGVIDKCPCSIGTCSLRRHRHMFHAVQGHVALGVMDICPCSIGACSLRRHRHMFHAVQGHVALGVIDICSCSIGTCSLRRHRHMSMQYRDMQPQASWTYVHAVQGHVALGVMDICPCSIGTCNPQTSQTYVHAVQGHVALGALDIFPCSIKRFVSFVHYAVQGPCQVHVLYLQTYSLILHAYYVHLPVHCKGICLQMQHITCQPSYIYISEKMVIPVKGMYFLRNTNE